MPHGFDSMFAWTIFIFLLTGFTLFCWMGSFYIFEHPEKASNYHLLKRLHKIEEPQRFEITTAPRGEFLKPSQLLQRYGVLTPMDIKRLNEKLFRNFLRNYHQTRELVTYATGMYKVLMVVPLTKKNIFYPGVVTLLQSLEEPKILLEQVFTSNLTNLPALEASVSLSQELKLEKPRDLSALIFLEMLSDGRLKLTTMPLLYGTYGTTGNRKSTFTLQPPENINIEAGLPLLSKKQVGSVNQTLSATSRKLTSVDSASTPSTPLNKENRLLSKVADEEHDLSKFAQADYRKPPEGRAERERVGQPSGAQIRSRQETLEEESIEVTEQSTLTVEFPKESTIPKAIPINKPTILPAIPLNAPSASKTSIDPKIQPTLLSISEPSQHEPATPATPSLAQPFSSTPTTLPSKPDDTTTSTLSSESISPAISTRTPENTTIPNNPSNNTWPLYDPGKMPRGRMLSPIEVEPLAQQGFSGERLYLSGDFAVIASSDHRALLRYQPASTNLPMSHLATIRVIVEYPSATIPPAIGTSLSQDCLHPLMVTDVKKETNGTINLYVRSIIK